MKASPSHQAEALKLLFALLHNNPKFVKEFYDMGGHDLLTKVFASVPCYIGPQIIKVIKHCVVRFYLNMFYICLCIYTVNIF